MKKLAKALFCLTASLLLLVVSFAAISQTRSFKDWARIKLLALVNSKINGELSGRQLSGNFFTELRFEHLALDVEGKTVLKIGQLSLQYNPLALLSGHVSFKKIIIETPWVYLARDPHSRWNLSKILTESGRQVETGAEAYEEPFGWQLDLPNIRIVSGSAGLEPATARRLGVPQRLKNLDLNLGLWLHNDLLKASLENLSFETEAPALRVRTLLSDMALDDHNLKASNFEISTEQSELQTHVEIENLEDPVISLQVTGKPVSLDEIRRAVPEVKLYGNPRIDFEAKGPLRNLAVKGGVHWGKGKIDFSGKLDVDESPYEYDLQGAVSDLNLTELTNDSTYQSDLNFGFDLRGRGTDREDLTATLSAEFDTSKVAGKTFEAAILRCEVRNDTIDFDLDSEVAHSTLALTGTLVTATKRPAYQMTAHVRNLDADRFDPGFGISSDLNFSCDLRGSGFEPEALSAHLQLSLFPSRINDVPIDSARIDLRLDKQKMTVQKFRLHSPVGEVAAHGLLALQGENNLELNIRFSDLFPFSPAVAGDTLAGSGTFDATMTGPADSLHYQATLDMSGVRVTDLRIGGLHATGSGLFTHSGNQLTLRGVLAEIQRGPGMAVDTAAFGIEYVAARSLFDVSLQKNDLFAAATHGQFQLEGKAYVAEFSDLEIDFLDQTWQQASENATLHVRADQFDLTGLILHSDQQTLMLAGRISTTGSNAFRCELRNLDVQPYQGLVSETINVQGRLSFEAYLAGTFANPRFDGSVVLDKGQYYEVPFEKFLASFEFQNELLAWRCTLAKTGSDSLLEANARLPVRLSLSPFEHRFLTDEPLELKISTRGLDLSFLQAFTREVEKIDGKLVADVVLRNTLNDLRGVGPIRLINGECTIPKLGTRYEQANLVLVLDEKQLIIRDFSMRSGGGYMRALEGNLSLSRDRIENFKSRIKLKNFELVHNRQMQARAEGIIELSGSVQSPQFSGSLTVDQSRIFYEALKTETAVALTARPFFVISPDSTIFDSAGALRFQKSEEVQESKFLESDFYKRLTGELSVYFPRNAWVRSSDTAIEIEGDVVVVKERGPDFVVFGSFSTIRGFYELLGNRFQINKGELVFNGEAELNPAISIEAATTVLENVDSGNPEKHEFKVLITGTLLFPEFAFTLDDKAAEQDDIVSILLFGKTNDDRSKQFPGTPSSQGSDVKSDPGLDERARGLVAGQLLKQLSGRLGKRLNLDVIQIESGGSLTDSKVRVGKYVTPEVFVSVSQDFGAEGNQIVELEYEIPLNLRFLNLLLQASSDRKGDTGLDVIWKIEW
ncbi:MAG: translocation/assembly module TamB domain-containing protein [bacterium]